MAAVACVDGVGTALCCILYSGAVGFATVEAIMGYRDRRLVYLRTLQRLPLPSGEDRGGPKGDANGNGGRDEAAVGSITANDI